MPPPPVKESERDEHRHEPHVEQKDSMEVIDEIEARGRGRDQDQRKGTMPRPPSRDPDTAAQGPITAHQAGRSDT